jgi:hypothetical protein
MRYCSCGELFRFQGAVAWTQQQKAYNDLQLYEQFTTTRTTYRLPTDKVVEVIQPLQNQGRHIFITIVGESLQHHENQPVMTQKPE